MAVPKIFKITITGVAATIGLGLVIAVLVLWLYDFSSLKPTIEKTVSDTLGREFNIDGNFELELLPTPRLLAESTRLNSPDWGTEPQMLAVGKVSVEIELFSVLFQPVTVRTLALEDVRILVETGPDEKLNWNLVQDDTQPVEEKPAAPEPNDIVADPGLPVIIQQARLKNITVIYRKPDTEDQQLFLDTFTIKQDDGKTMLFDGKGKLLEQSLALSGKLTAKHTDLKAQLGKIEFLSAYDYSKNTVDITASLGKLSAVGHLLDIENLPDEDLTIKGQVSFEQEKTVFKDVVASMAGVNATLNGTVDDEALRLSLQAKGDQLSVLKPTLPNIPFSLQTELTLAGNTIDLTPFSLTLGESTINGTAHVQTGDGPNDAIAVKAEAKSALLDLSPFMADEANDKAQDPAETPSKSRYVFKDTPLPLDVLQTLNADINTDVALLRVDNGEIKALKIQAVAKNGTLKLKSTFAGKYSGKFDNELVIETSDTNAVIKLKTTITEFKVVALSGPNVPVEKIPQTSMAINLHSSGASPRTLASSLDGRIVVNQGAGSVSNKLIDKFSGDVISQLFGALNPFAKNEEFSHWDCSLFAIDFHSGEGEITGFLLQSEKLLAVGGGDIDLNTEQLNVEFNTKPRTGVGVSADMFVTPFIKLSGTLAAPSVGLNNTGILLSGGAAVLTGGMSFLYTGLMDRVTAQGSHCDAAVAALNKANAKTDADTETNANKTHDEAGDKAPDDAHDKMKTPKKNVIRK